jgi:hypothetical protein
MSQKYIYDVKSSSLYDVDGSFLKKVFCPKAQQWNQLLADDPLDRSRGCNKCKHRVVNLDTSTSINWFDNEEPCVYISTESTTVIFLHDVEALPAANSPDKDKKGIVVIKTARTVEDINRAAAMGYWPDIRLIEYKDRESDVDLFAEVVIKKDIAYPIQSKFSIGQNATTGCIEISGDFRRSFNSHRSYEDFLYEEIIPFTFYYPNYQSVPVAAYLIPPDLPDGSKVVVEDPIEDLIGRVWNQGDVSRAEEVKGYVQARKVHIDYKSVKRSDVVG